jgi:hypothetical protein
MKKVYLILVLIFGSLGVFSQTLFDSFGDGDYTNTPTWAGTASWTIVANSDVAAGATGSNTLRLNSGAVATTDYLSSQIGTWGASQEWGFFMGRRAQAATVANQSYVWLYANEATIFGSATVDGYRIAFGDDAGNDNIRLEYIVNGALSATIITSPNTAAGTTLNGITDFGFLVRVTRSATGAWEIFTSTLPQVNGAGAIASDIPNAANANVSQGTATHNTLVPTTNGYIGVAAVHSTGGSAIVGQEFDQFYFTSAVAGTPNIIVVPIALSGFSSVSGVPSAEQTYTVSGTDLTADIVITPPAGFEISLTTGPFTATNPINLTPTAGTVSSTTIYVRMNSVTLGANSGNITHTSAGANNPNVSLTGNVLAAEPTVQSTITIGAVTNSTVVVNFGGGNGARRILLARLATAVNSDPVDGTTYTANANFGSGSQIGVGNYVVYDGTLNTQLVTGLTAGATYHFAIYEYNDGGVAGAENYLVPGGVGNATLATYSVPYVWIGLNGDWQVPVNWLPTRLFPATNDSLLFISALTDTIINVPTQTVGYIGASLLTNTTLQAAASGNVLTIGNLTGTDLFIQTGSAFNIASANALTLNLVTSATASVDGNMTFTAGGHRFTGTDASSVIFNSGSVFTAGTGFTGNAFGVLNLNSIVFASGSRYDYITGSNPFGAPQPTSVLTFQTGSLFRAIGNNPSPAFSGRNYANVEFAGTGIATMTGGNAVTMDHLTITSGIVNINMTAVPGHSIKGNIAVAAGSTLNFAPASAGTFNLNGTAAQSITNAGALSFSVNQNVNINNAAGITLNSPVSLLGILNFTSGLVNTSATNLLTMAAGSSVIGASNASFVFGPIKKIGNTPFTFPVGKANGLVPIGISNFIGGLVTDEFTAEYIRSSAAALGPITDPLIRHVSGCDYWTLNLNNGAPTVDITGYWNANNPCNGTYINNLATLAMVHFDGTNWNSSSVGFNPPPNGTTAAGDITWPSVNTFSPTFTPFALGSSGLDNPLPIIINYFTGTKQNGNHLLNWKVTCASTPNVTIELERSTDGRNYNSIYSIFATAVRCQQPFDHTDNQPAKGVNYYRLKMTDADGKITYSSIVSLINAVKGFEVMNIAPNPIVNGSFNLKVSAAAKAQMEVVIADMQGRILEKRSVSMIAGFNSIPMNVRNLAAGTYQLFGNTEDGRTKTLRFVIQ